MTTNMNKILVFFLVFYSCVSILTKSLSANCLCDVSDQCDNECCCDSSCSPLLVSKWTQINLCSDDSLSIPMCNSLSSQPLKTDLYSGLTTLYNIIKRLFCISRINFVDPNSLYKTQPSQSQKNGVASNSAISALDTRFKALSIATDKQFPYRNSLGFCTTTTKPRLLYYVPYEQCRFLIQNIGVITNHSFLSISGINNAIPNIKIISSSTAGADVQSNSSLITSCGTTSCQNVVTYIKLVFQVVNNQATLLPISYALVSNFTFSSILYKKISYSYEYVATITNIVPSGSVGYNLGSPLQLLKKGNNTLRIFNPINLAFRNADGQCRTASSESDNSPLIYLQFGKDEFYTCIGSNSSMLLQNLQQLFTHIGVIGNPSSLNDYLQLTLPPKDPSKSLRFLIFYAKIGGKDNAQYRIVKISVSYVNKFQNQIALYFEYKQVSNQPSLYIPSPPLLEAYLPNDFLYPFFVA